MKCSFRYNSRGSLDSSSGKSQLKSPKRKLFDWSSPSEVQKSPIPKLQPQTPLFDTTNLDSPLSLHTPKVSIYLSNKLLLYKTLSNHLFSFVRSRIGWILPCIFKLKGTPLGKDRWSPAWGMINQMKSKKTLTKRLHWAFLLYISFHFSRVLLLLILWYCI